METDDISLLPLTATVQSTLRKVFYLFVPYYVISGQVKMDVKLVC